MRARMLSIAVAVAVASLAALAASAAPTVTFFTDTPVVPLGEQVTMMWQSSQPQAGDWVGLFKLGDPSDAAHRRWFDNVSGRTSGTGFVRLPGNLTDEGNFEFRYFRGSGFDRIETVSEAVLNLKCGRGRPYSNIEHIVLVVQENHGFDSIFGSYCKAPTGSKPTCNTGPACCEQGPATEPGVGAKPFVLSDQENADFDPNHGMACEVAEINKGKMDRFVNGTWEGCSNPHNFAYAEEASAGIYWDFARNYAISDNYWQPLAGATAANNMYLARAGWMFNDNDAFPYRAIGVSCNTGNEVDFNIPNIGDMFRVCGISYTAFAGGYLPAKKAYPKCAPIPDDCAAKTDQYPCTFDASDIPFQYFRNLRDNSEYIKDLDTEFEPIVRNGQLPSFSYVKPIGYKTEHPGGGTTLSTGARTVKWVVDTILKSDRYRNNTLILVTYDEGGGYFDHVSPPADSAYDKKPYGTRMPIWAIGEFAKRGHISHVQAEHSSVVKLLQFNWFNNTGQLATRDSLVNHITDLLDPRKTGPLPN